MANVNTSQLRFYIDNSFWFGSDKNILNRIIIMNIRNCIIRVSSKNDLSFRFFMETVYIELYVTLSSRLFGNLMRLQSNGANNGISQGFY